MSPKPANTLLLQDKHGKIVGCPMCKRDVHIQLFGGSMYVVECGDHCHRTEPSRKEETARKRWAVWAASYEAEQAGMLPAEHSHAKLQEATISRLEKLQVAQRQAVLRAGGTVTPASLGDPLAPGAEQPPDLLPCPYCGNTAPVYDFSDGDALGRGVGYYIRCDKCWARGPIRDPNVPYGHYRQWNEVAARGHVPVSPPTTFATAVQAATPAILAAVQHAAKQIEAKREEQARITQARNQQAIKQYLDNLTPGSRGGSQKGGG